MNESDTDIMASLDYLATPMKLEAKEEQAKKENEVVREGTKQPAKSTLSRQGDQSYDASPNTNPSSPTSLQESGSSTASVVTRGCRRSSATSSEAAGTSHRALKLLEERHAMERIEISRVM